MASEEKPRGRGFGRQFQKGQSGNPRGRPKNDQSLTALLRREIRKICPEDRMGRTYLELIVQATMRLAIKGNATALSLVWDRLDGKVAFANEVENPREVIIRVEYDQDKAPRTPQLPKATDASR
jgi:hypothetical protein